MKDILRALPGRCQLCHHPLAGTPEPWCIVCQSRFPLTPRCNHCGLPTVEHTGRCGECLVEPPSWDNLTCIGDYTFPYDRLLQRFKYSGQFWLAGPLARLLAPRITEPAPLLLPVPMHWQRRMVRGYNHSALLCRPLASLLGVRDDRSIIRRIRHTRMQQGLGRRARLSNLESAFDISCDLSGQHVAIVDDVVTTGATVSTLCDLLRRRGAEKIDVYCLCRTPVAD